VRVSGNAATIRLARDSSEINVDEPTRRPVWWLVRRWQLPNQFQSNPTAHGKGENAALSPDFLQIELAGPKAFAE
jgi:hypothetical protein